MQPSNSVMTLLNNISPSSFLPSRPVTALTLNKSTGIRLNTPSIDIKNITPNTTSYANYLRSRESKGLKSEKKFAVFIEEMSKARVASAKKLKTTIDSFVDFDKETKELAVSF
jgi:hypothetical protein